MSDEIAIKVQNISKTFKLPHEKTTTIKGAVINFYKRKKSYEQQQALKDISFEVKKGEFFGIVGRNGSGKSTLLKMLAGIYTPSKGEITVNGNLTPFIELGVGFNQELSGRENVYLNGALLGFNRKEMDVMYDDIVEFAEIKRFMDQKLKNYSSGMQVRLAFSIAIQAKSDILILDEVLAVGDEAFQKKCIDVFENYKSNKQTVILVTHDMATVKRFCTRAILIDGGSMIMSGAPSKVTNAYSELNNQSISTSIAKKNVAKDKERSTKLRLLTDNIINYSDKAVLRIDWSACGDRVQNVGVAVYQNTGEYVFGANTILDKIAIGNTRQIDYSLCAELGPGNYHFKIGVFGKTDREIIEFIDDGPEFTIKQPVGLKWEGLTFLEHEWETK